MKTKKVHVTSELNTRIACMGYEKEPYEMTIEDIKKMYSEGCND